jgi:hypothetical protein
MRMEVCVALPGHGDEQGGIHPVVEAFFYKYLQAYGRPPPVSSNGTENWEVPVKALI